METLSEIYDTKELPEGKFLVTLNGIYWYQQKWPCLSEKYIFVKYNRAYFCGVQNAIDVIIPEGVW